MQPTVLLKPGRYYHIYNVPLAGKMVSYQAALNISAVDQA